MAPSLNVKVPEPLTEPSAALESTTTDTVMVCCWLFDVSASPLPALDGVSPPPPVLVASDEVSRLESLDADEPSDEASDVEASWLPAVSSAASSSVDSSAPPASACCAAVIDALPEASTALEGDTSSLVASAMPHTVISATQHADSTPSTMR